MPEETPLASDNLELTVDAVVGLAWRHRTQLAAATFIGLLLGVGLSFILPKRYEAHASFIGVGGSSLRLPSNLGGLSNLAGQLGLSGISTDPSALSPYFYADLLSADTILKQLAASMQSEGDGKAPLPFYEWLGLGGRSRADSLDRAATVLRRMCAVNLESRTGMIRITFTARNPRIAASAADSLLRLLNAFITRDLRTRAGAQRRFLQDRLVQADSQLVAREDQLRLFLETNRAYQGSPALVFREAELRRDVDLQRDLYLSIARSLEEARMNEVRDTPLISVIDAPAEPLRSAGPRKRNVAGVTGLLFLLGWFGVIAIRAARHP
jgi:uncharacterized protein involved in exopolysaccharide biosynthesis